jgi:flagellar motor switch protein FliG
MMTLKYLDRGGVDYARGALEKAVGPKKAKALLATAESIRTQSS